MKRGPFCQILKGAHRPRAGGPVGQSATEGMIRRLHECVDAQGSFFADVIVRVKSIVDIEMNEADFEAPLTIDLT